MKITVNQLKGLIKEAVDDKAFYKKPPPGLSAIESLRDKNYKGWGWAWDIPGPPYTYVEVFEQDRADGDGYEIRASIDDSIVMLTTYYSEEIVADYENVAPMVAQALAVMAKKMEEESIPEAEEVAQYADKIGEGGVESRLKHGFSPSWGGRKPKLSESRITLDKLKKIIKEEVCRVLR